MMIIFIILINESLIIVIKPISIDTMTIIISMTRIVSIMSMMTRHDSHDSDDD